MSKKFSGKFSAKGYYIALILCAAAIGISGYLYYRNLNQNNTQMQEPTENVDVMNPTQGDDLPVVAPDGENDPIFGADKTIITCVPVTGQTIMEYAMECLAYNPTTRDWRTHNGIDIAAEAGTPVCAAAKGTVYNVYTDDTMGTTVVIRHENGYVTQYASLSADVTVSAGDIVEMGQTIGHVGNTALMENAIGDHLHFTVTYNGEAVDPVGFLDHN